jgi:hypothetical protein
MLELKLVSSHVPAEADLRVHHSSTKSRGCTGSGKFVSPNASPMTISIERTMASSGWGILQLAERLFQLLAERIETEEGIGRYCR